MSGRSQSIRALWIDLPSSGNFPGVTMETATKRDGNCTGSLPSGTWNADAVGFLTVAENYSGTIEVEYLVK